MKNYRVTLSWNVQKTYFVNAKDSEEANDKAIHGGGLDESYDSYEFDDYIETVEEDE